MVVAAHASTTRGGRCRVLQVAFALCIFTAHAAAPEPPELPTARLAALLRSPASAAARWGRSALAGALGGMLAHSPIRGGRHDESSLATPVLRSGRPRRSLSAATKPQQAEAKKGENVKRKGGGAKRGAHARAPETGAPGCHEVVHAGSEVTCAVESAHFFGAGRMKKWSGRCVDADDLLAQVVQRFGLRAREGAGTGNGTGSAEVLVQFYDRQLDEYIDLEDSTWPDFVAQTCAKIRIGSCGMPVVNVGTSDPSADRAEDATKSLPAEAHGERGGADDEAEATRRRKHKGAENAGSDTTSGRLNGPKVCGPSLGSAMVQSLGAEVQKGADGDRAGGDRECPLLLQPRSERRVLFQSPLASTPSGKKLDPGRKLVQGTGANGQNREPTSCRAGAAPFDGLSSGHLAPAAALGGSAQGEPSDAGVNYVGACGALSGCEALPCDSPRLTAPGGMLLDEEGSRGGAAVGSDEESGGDSLSLLSPTREERDYSEIVLASCTPTSPAVEVKSAYRGEGYTGMSTNRSTVATPVQTRGEEKGKGKAGELTGGAEGGHQSHDDATELHARGSLTTVGTGRQEDRDRRDARIETTQTDTSPVTSRSFSATASHSLSAFLTSATSLGASPTIPEAVTPVRRKLEEQGFPKTALRGSRRFGHHVDTILGTKAETVCAPKSALRGRFNFSKNPAPFASPTATKKISFDLSGVGPGTVTASDDGLQDAEIAAECLGTPRTPGGGRGVMCEWSRNGREFQTALRQTAAQRFRSATGSEALFVTPMTPKTRSCTPAISAATPTPRVSASGMAFRRQRDALVADIVAEFNSSVFEGCLPADLEISWSRLYSKTAGMTKFRMLAPADPDETDPYSEPLVLEEEESADAGLGTEEAEDDIGWQTEDSSHRRNQPRASTRRAGIGSRSRSRSRSRGRKHRTGLEEAEILTASVELSSKIIDNAERLRCTLAHELCHVAQWVVNRQAKPPHGEAFRLWAERVEAYDPSLQVTTCHAYAIKYKFEYRCEECGNTYGRQTRSIDVDTQACGECHGRLLCETPGRTPGKTNAFAAFVKHHFQAAKEVLNTGLTSETDLPHAKVMSLLANMWQTLKRQGNADLDPRDVDIDALALDFVAELSVQT